MGTMTKNGRWNVGPYAVTRLGWLVGWSVGVDHALHVLGPTQAYLYPMQTVHATGKRADTKPEDRV